METLIDKHNGERKPTTFRGGIASPLDKSAKNFVNYKQSGAGVASDVKQKGEEAAAESRVYEPLNSPEAHVLQPWVAHQKTQDSQDKWPIVSLRLQREHLAAILNLTGETSFGKGVKAAVLDYLRIKGVEGVPQTAAPKQDCHVAPTQVPATPTVSSPAQNLTTNPITHQPAPADCATCFVTPDNIVCAPKESPVETNPQSLTSTPTPQVQPPPQPQVAESAAMPQIAEALAELAKSIQTLKQTPPPVAAVPGQQYATSQAMPTEAQMDIRNASKITEQDFRMYFKRMRAVGQRDATQENEDAFWQYLIAADFCKMDGMPINKLNLASSFIAWVRARNKEAHEAQAKAVAEAAAKKEAEDKAAADRKAYEDWNNQMLKWDGIEDD